MMALLLDPRYKVEVEAMYDRLELFWRSNVKRFFSKSETNYDGLNTRYRQYVSWRDMQGNRLTNALVVNYNSKGAVRIGAKQILVPLRGGSKYTDLIEYLRKGTKASPGRYILWKDARKSWSEYTPADEDKYRKRGEKGLPKDMGKRSATTEVQWNIWWAYFMNEVDKELKILADRSADIFVDDVVMKLQKLESGEF